MSDVAVADPDAVACERLCHLCLTYDGKHTPATVRCRDCASRDFYVHFCDECNNFLHGRPGREGHVRDASTVWTKHTLQSANAHVWGVVMAWVAADEASDCRSLRATCRRAVMGFDVAVHSGQVPLAAHVATVPPEEGATCRWANWWWPVTWQESWKLRSGLHCVRAESGFLPSTDSGGLPPHPAVNEWLEKQRELAQADRRQTEALRKALRCTEAALRGLPELVFCETRAEQPHPVSMPVLLSASKLSFCVSQGTSLSALSMTSCVSVVDVDFGGLGGVTALADGTLAEAPLLQRVRATAPNRVATLGRRFCAKCPALVELDLRNFSRLERLDDEFASYCDVLASFRFDGLTSLTAVGDSCLAYCDALAVVDFSAAPALETIGKNFARNCPALRSVDIVQLRGLRSIGPSFASECTFLVVLRVHDCPQLDTIGNEFARRCPSLACCEFERLPALTSIADWFLSECCELDRFDTSGMPNVASVGDRWLAKCSNLAQVNPAGFGKLATVGTDFLAECPVLSSFSTATMRQVVKLGKRAFSFCTGLRSFNAAGLVASMPKFDPGMKSFMAGVPVQIRVEATAGWPSGGKSMYQVGW